MSSFGDAFGKLVVGSISSVGTFIIWYIYKFIKFRNLYSGFSGRYVLEDLRGNRIGTGFVTVKHTGERGIAISCDTPPERWESRIMMSEDIRDFGQGIYQHGGKTDCGIHQIQLNRSQNLIYVFGKNTSHVDGATFTYIMKRQDPQIG
jgi:hypothetical protein